MRSVILIGLGVFLGVLAGGVAMTWYSQAGMAKSAVERAVAHINRTQTYLTYESIETSGFPVRVNVALVNPRFKGRMDGLVKELLVEALLTNDLSAIPPWEAEYSIDGKLIFGVNLFSDRYRVGTTGDWREESRIGDKQFRVLYQYPKGISCELEMKNQGGIFGALWDYQSLARKSEQFREDFRSFDCAIPGHAAIDAENQAPQASYGSLRFLFANAPAIGGMNDMRIYFEFKDFEVTAAGDTRIAAYQSVFYPGNPYPYPPRLAPYGKQNIILNFTMRAPVDWDSQKDNMPIAISINPLSINNRIYTHQTEFSFNNGMKSDRRSARLALASESSFTKEYDALMQYTLRGTLHNVLTDQHPKAADMKDMLNQYTPEQLFTIIYPAVPDVTGMGKMTLAVDAGYDGSPDFTAGDASVKGFELSTADYGLSGEADAKLAPGGMPAGNALLTCANCLSLIDDLAGYMRRLQKTVSYFDAEHASMFEADPALVEAIKRFLSALALPGADGNKDTLRFAFANAPETGVSINGKPMNEVMALFREQVEPARKALPMTPAPTP